jgi:hypothetical protein
MKDIKNLIIYGGLSFGLILLLVILARNGAVSSDVIGVLAIIGVVVVPVVISVFIGKKEKQKKHTSGE